MLRLLVHPHWTSVSNAFFKIALVALSTESWKLDPTVKDELPAGLGRGYQRQSVREEVKGQDFAPPKWNPQRQRVSASFVYFKVFNAFCSGLVSV